MEFDQWSYFFANNRDFWKLQCQRIDDAPLSTSIGFRLQIIQSLGHRNWIKMKSLLLFSFEKLGVFFRSNKKITLSTMLRFPVFIVSLMIRPAFAAQVTELAITRISRGTPCGILAAFGVFQSEPQSESCITKVWKCIYLIYFFKWCELIDEVKKGFNLKADDKQSCSLWRYLGSRTISQLKTDQ